MGEVLVDVVLARGHELIKALHRTTFEVTKDSYLTPRGDCIIGISASKALSDLDPLVRSEIAKDDSVIIIDLVAGRASDRVVCRGSRALRLSSDRKIIVRKSRFIDDATLCIEANKSARDLNRELVNELRKGLALVMKIMVLRV